MLNNKRILFIGPLGNPDNKFIQQYDIIIRTNNFFSIDPQLLKSTRCDILVVNKLYSSKYTNIINENIHKLKYVLAKNKPVYDILIQNINPIYKHKILYMSYKHGKHPIKIDKQPLIVCNLLLYIIEYFKPKILFLTGFDFYMSHNINKFWLPGYAIKESTTYNVLNGDKNTHNILSNIQFFNYCLNKYNWIKCDSKISELVKTFG